MKHGDELLYSKLMQIDSSSVGSRKKNIRRQLRQIHFDPKVDAPSFELPLNSLQEGKTGYPFIDALMRQLNQTGGRWA